MRIPSVLKITARSQNIGPGRPSLKVIWPGIRIAQINPESTKVITIKLYQYPVKLFFQFINAATVMANKPGQRIFHAYCARIPFRRALLM